MIAMGINSINRNVQSHCGGMNERLSSIPAVVVVERVSAASFLFALHSYKAKMIPLA